MKKPIPNFEKYYIYDTGDVYNTDTNKMLEGTIRLSGYKVYRLSKDGKKYQFYAHRLVAENFIPNPNFLPQVNHINEDKRDNRVENLEWSSALHNLEHSRVIEKASVAKFTKVRCITTDRIYDSIKEAADEFGLAHSNIVACCNGRRLTCGGMRWEYI